MQACCIIEYHKQLKYCRQTYMRLATATSYMSNQAIRMEGMSTGKHIKRGHVPNRRVASSYLV